MVSSVSAMVWRDVVGKRWMRCGVWQVVITCGVWIVWETVFSALIPRSSNARNESGSSYMSSVWAASRFLCFQASQMMFLLGQTFVSEPEERDIASFRDVVSGLCKLAWRAVVGGSREETATTHIAELRQKIRTTLDHVSFTLLCVVSGVLSFFALTWSAQLDFGSRSSLDAVIRGGALGLAYAGFQFYHMNVALRFPIIQRRLFFAFKMGIPRSVEASLKLVLIVLPVGEAVAQVASWDYVGASNPFEVEVLSFLWRQLLSASGIFFVAFCWETCHNLVQVIQTKRHVLAPPLGSTAAETDPTDSLLMVLEESKTGSLVQYHAFLDLCIVSETNVDTWRRAAFFEETGETYKRLINVCLKKLDGLTLRLAQGLEVGDSDRNSDLLKHQMQPSTGENRQLVFQLSDAKSYFQDSQLCSWCARTVASLTASSRFEDRYGVAQLHGCNVAVVSSLLSCLLVIEVYLGRRSSVRGVSFVPNSIKWTVPSRGSFMEVGKRQGYPFGKRTLMHKKAYSMADVLRTSLYQIVSVFGEEMVQVGPGGKVSTIAERDWLCRKPLYGTHEMHLQKLGTFLEYRIG